MFIVYVQYVCHPLEYLYQHKSKSNGPVECCLHNAALTQIEEDTSVLIKTLLFFQN